MNALPPPDRRALRQATREISYASSARSPVGQRFVRLVENATGRIGLIRRADGYEVDVAAGADFWAVMAARYGLDLQVTTGALGAIPSEGPLVVVGNHPFGILDGLMLGHILSQRRGPDGFRIIAHRVFRKAEEIDRIILPIAFDETPEAVRTNIATRADAIAHLRAGGCIGIFPGGTVSTAARPFGPPMDPRWRRFTGRLIAKSGAAVVPIHFEGTNSRLFQLASHTHYTLRLALMIREFRRRVDGPVRIAIGQPIQPDQIAAHAGTAAGLMDFLRARTYDLAGLAPGEQGLGYEFEEQHRDPDAQQGRFY